MRKHSCPRCNGWGIFPYVQPSVVVKCDNCMATGLDPQYYDVPKWIKAVEHLVSLYDCLYEWEEDGKELGLKHLTEDIKISYEDFLLEKQ